MAQATNQIRPESSEGSAPAGPVARGIRRSPVRVAASTAPSWTSTQKASVILSLANLVGCILLELGAILALNDGHLVFTLDDPYVHLALAEHLQRGHYGVNPNELSAPSSGIVWPFLLAPFVHLPSSFSIFVLANALLGSGLKSARRSNGIGAVSAGTSGLMWSEA